MPRIVNVEETKERIMAEAIHVFVKMGYHRATFAEIARRCGIGRTTIYQYFKNKEDIYIFAIKHVNRIFETEYKNILEDANLKVLEKIKKIFTKLILRCNEKDNEIVLLIELWLILKRDNYELPEQVKRSFELQDVFHRLLEEGARTKQIRPLRNTESMAFTLEAFLESLMFHQPFMKPGEMKSHLNNLHLLIDGLGTT